MSALLPCVYYCFNTISLKALNIGRKGMRIRNAVKCMYYFFIIFVAFGIQDYFVVQSAIARFLKIARINYSSSCVLNEIYPPPPISPNHPFRNRTAHTIRVPCFVHGSQILLSGIFFPVYPSFLLSLYFICFNFLGRTCQTA